MKGFDLVLLIDDDSITNIINRKILDRGGCSVTVKDFTTGLGALQFLEKRLAADQNMILVLLDINMPGMTGWEFLDHIEKRLKYKSIEIHILSSSIDFVDQCKADGHPFVKSIISKPLTVEKVQQLLY